MKKLNIKKTIKQYNYNIKIEKYKIKSNQIIQIYQNTIDIPQFFHNNLISKYRKIKSFVGPYALFEVFYFQIMKLVLEVHIEDIDYLQIFKNKLLSFQYISEGLLNDQYFSDQQYRSLLSQFLQKVQADEIPQFQKYANQYPIIDEVLMKMISAICPINILQLAKKAKDKQTQRKQIKNILQNLCQFFHVNVSQIDQCLKFQESDCFLYYNTLQQMYLAFDDQYLKNINIQDFDKNKSLIIYQSNKQNSQSQQQIQEQEQKQQKIKEITHNQKQLFFNPIQNNLQLNQKTHKFTINKQFLLSINNKYTIKQSTSIINVNNKIKQKDKQSIGNYQDFTNTFILNIINQQNKNNIYKIKNKYQRPERKTIKKFF